MRTLRTLAILVFLFVFAWTSAAQTADGTLWRYVHPEAKFLFGVDWQKAKISSVGKMFAGKMSGPNAPKVSRTGKGMEMLDKVNLILVSSPTVEGMSSEGPGRAIVALEGRFDKAEFRKAMPPGTAIERFKGVDLFVPPKSKDDEMLVAYVSEQFALMGDRQSIAETLDSSGSGLKDQRLMERATHLASSCELWLLADAPPTPPGYEVTGSMKQLEDMESLELGVQLAKGLGMEMNMNMKTVESAQGISMMAQMFMSMAANQTRQSDEFTRALKSMKVTQTGKQVHMSLNIPTATLERGMVAMKSSIETQGRQALEAMMAGGFTATKPAAKPAGREPVATMAQAEMAPPAPAAPPQPVKKTIRIVGLENGDREVSYTSRPR